MSVINDTKSMDGDLANLLSSEQDRANLDCRPSAYCGWKCILDRMTAVILLVPGIPMIGLLVLLVRMTSRGPGIYRQVRVGKGGRTFKMYKIRTMSNDAEVGTGPQWTTENDPRITRIGCLLRKLHLDELPQLFNVLKGEMSLVGPRPERPEFVHVLAKEIPGYVNRLAVRPGVTGLAQINLPPDTDLDSVRRKLVLDLEYATRAGLSVDVRMMLCTSLRLLGFSGERAARIMKLHRSVTLPGKNGKNGSRGDGMSPDGVVRTVGKGHTTADAASSRNGGGRGRRGKLQAGASRKPR